MRSDSGGRRPGASHRRSGRWRRTASLPRACRWLRRAHEPLGAPWPANRVWPWPSVAVAPHRLPSRDPRPRTYPQRLGRRADARPVPGDKRAPRAPLVAPLAPPRAGRDGPRLCDERRRRTAELCAAHPLRGRGARVVAVATAPHPGRVGARDDRHRQGLRPRRGGAVSGRARGGRAERSGQRSPRPRGRGRPGDRPARRRPGNCPCRSASRPFPPCGASPSRAVRLHDRGPGVRLPGGGARALDARAARCGWRD